MPWSCQNWWYGGAMVTYFFYLEYLAIPSTYNSIWFHSILAFKFWCVRCCNGDRRPLLSKEMSWKVNNQVYGINRKQQGFFHIYKKATGIFISTANGELLWKKCVIAWKERVLLLWDISIDTGHECIRIPLLRWCFWRWVTREYYDPQLWKNRLIRWI